ncbi:MAG: hypothetical protein ACXVFT_25360, partial [Solirubrobacteraceae bacterium]
GRRLRASGIVRTAITALLVAPAAAVPPALPAAALAVERWADEMWPKISLLPRLPAQVVTTRARPFERIRVAVEPTS